jgi:tellurite resistance protein TerC
MLSLKQAKRVAVAIIGFSVLLVGLAMIVLPGPAILVIPLGLGILATEFLWARKLLNRIKGRILRKENSYPGSDDLHGTPKGS